MSSPRTGYAAINTDGAAAISRPTSTFCYVAAGETADRGIKALGVTTSRSLIYLVGEVVRLLSVQKDGAPLAVAAQHHVVDYVHVSDKSHAETVLGHERQTDTEVAYLYLGVFVCGDLCALRPSD